MTEGYVHLNDNITKTLDLISDVDNSSKMQQDGIERINKIVSNLVNQTKENTTIASQTRKIAEQTNEIAYLVVRDADEKKFIGKDTVKAKFLG